MNTFHSNSNDGTIIISNKIKAPAQGTWVSILNGLYTLAKGVIRPQLKNPITNQVEQEAHVENAAFGRNMADSPDGRFYSIGEIGRRNFNLNMQTVLFASKYPASVIEQDNKRFEHTTVLDMLSKESARKVKAGVPPALLIEAMTPSDMFRKLEAKGIRATAFASDLVSPDNELPLWRQSASLDKKIECALKIACNGKIMSQFMLLPGSAHELAKQCNCSEADMLGRIFLLHRDPALPDATSLFPSVYLGSLEWDNECTANYGVILHPKDEFFFNAGGDFDGDDVSVIVPTHTLLPYGPISRPDYVLSSRPRSNDSIEQQMLGSAADTVTGLLGPVILAATRLLERREANDAVRAVAAAVAQGSVSAKKHLVNVEAVTAEARLLFGLVRSASMDGTVPYISDYTNALKQASGVAEKEEAWDTFMRALPLWEEVGTDIEKALCKRARALNQLFTDTNYFRSYARPELPRSMIDAARSKCTATAKNAITAIADAYRAKAAALGEEPELDEDSNLHESHLADIRDEMKILRAKFSLAAITGNVDGAKLEPRDAQLAIIGYAPAKISAKLVSAELFEELGVMTRRVIVNLIGHNWKDGAIDIIDLNPIPNCAADIAILAKNSTRVQLQIISKAANSTRVCLSTMV